MNPVYLFHPLRAAGLPLYFDEKALRRDEKVNSLLKRNHVRRAGRFPLFARERV